MVSNSDEERHFTYLQTIDIDGIPKVVASSEPSSGEGYDMYLPTINYIPKRCICIMTTPLDMCTQMK